MAMAWLPVSHCSLFPDDAPTVAGTGGRGNANGGSAAVDAATGDASVSTGGGVGNPEASTSDRFMDSGGTGVLDSGRSDAPSDAGLAVRDAPSGSADASSTTLVYTATVAECVETGILDPDACRTYVNGAGRRNEMWVDIRRPPRQVFTGYVRFDVDGRVENRSIASVELELSVASYTESGGQSPSVWEVEPFTRDDLFGAEPARVGQAAIAGSLGLVERSAVVRYALPTDSVAANEPVYLSLAASGNDGTGFWNTAGNDPPRLLVVVE